MKTLVVLMAIIGVACSQPIPTATQIPTTLAPKWSESEAIAVFKNWCYPGNWPNLTFCERELSRTMDTRWSAI